MPPRDILMSRCTRALALGGLVLAAAVSLASAQPLDSPSLTVTDRGFFRIDLEVQAGESGAPAGFTLEWMRRSEFDLSGWPEDVNDPRLMHADFTGEPTLNPDPNSMSFQLGPNGLITVQVGDLFDETGVNANYLDPLVPGDYVFRVIAKGDPLAGATSAPSAAVPAATVPAECTQGFWKNHPSSWPVGCTPMRLGTVSYTKDQLLAIFGTPSAGNGLVSMAHQLIALKLNLCNGSNPANIQTTIDAADALIGSQVAPPVGTGYLSPASTSAHTNKLDNFNNGIIKGVVSCATAVRGSTWGHLKSMYR